MVSDLNFRNKKPVRTGSGLLKWVRLLTISPLFGLPAVHAQHATDYTIQANIIYRFTKYIDCLAFKGSCVNFITVHERLKLEINKNNIERRGIGIASELLLLGLP